jgi:uncharacterized protein (DUF1697 family)
MHQEADMALQSGARTPPRDLARYIALLRAINVGGHNVKMERLRTLFEELGLQNVETFIASGNVIFEAPTQDSHILEERIEAHLHASLGYEVATFIRSSEELARIAGYRPFPAEEMEDAASVYVAFLPHTPGEQAARKLLALSTDMDSFHLHEREIYWLCRVRMSESPFSGGLLEKTIGLPATLRNTTTVNKLAAKYAATKA